MKKLSAKKVGFFVVGLLAVAAAVAYMRRGDPMDVDAG